MGNVRKLSRLDGCLLLRHCRRSWDSAQRCLKGRRGISRKEDVSHGFCRKYYMVTRKLVFISGLLAEAPSSQERQKSWWRCGRVVVQGGEM